MLSVVHPPVGGWVLLTLMAALLTTLMRTPWVGVVNLDAAIFTLLGQSLASGQGYALISDPAAPPYFTFPPLLPLQIALIAQLLSWAGQTGAGALQLAAKGWIHLLFCASIPIYYGWARRRMDALPALALAAMLALNPLMYRYSGDILSDVPYWAASLASLACLDRWDAGGKRRWLALGLLFAALGVWTRQIGAALALAIWAWLGIKRRWRALTAALLSLGAACALWPAAEHVYRLGHPPAQSTLNQAGVRQTLAHSPLKLEFIKHFTVQNPVWQDRAGVTSDPGQYAALAAKRVADYAALTASQFLPPPLNHALLGALVWALALVGIRRLRGAAAPASLYVGAYALILMVYPYTTPRFLLPILPFMSAWATLGLLGAWNALASMRPGFMRWRRPALTAILALTLLGGHLPQTIRWVKAGVKTNLAGAGPSTRPENRAYYEALRWMAVHLRRDALIVSRKPPVTYYYSGLKSTAFPFSPRPEVVAGYLDALQRDAQADSSSKRGMRRFSGVYLLEDVAFGETRRSFEPLKQAYSQRLRRIHAFESGMTLWQWRETTDKHSDARE